MKLILGSSSQYRQSVLREKGYDFEVMDPAIDEKTIRNDDLYTLPLLIARAKADALLPKIKEAALLITADQVVDCDGELYEKPQDAEEARKFLKKYSDGHVVKTISAVVVTNSLTKEQAEGVDVAEVYFSQIPDKVIEEFIANGDPYSRAGGFAVQSEILKPYVAKMEGTMDSRLGMPLNLLEELIKKVS